MNHICVQAQLLLLSRAKHAFVTGGLQVHFEQSDKEFISFTFSLTQTDSWKCLHAGLLFIFLFVYR